MMIDNDGVNVTVICQAIEQHCQLWIDALQSSLADGSVKRGDERVRARADKAVGAANRNSICARRSDAVHSGNRDCARRDREQNSVGSRRRDSIGAIDRQRVVGAAGGDAVRVSNAARVRATSRDPIGAGGDYVVGAAGGTSGWVFDGTLVDSVFKPL